MKAPAIHREADWDDFELPFKIGTGRTMASGPDADRRLRVCFFRRRGDGHLVGKVWFGDGADGPPNHAHGGAIAYILDEAMGTAGWLHGLPVVAAELQFEYREMTPLYQDLGIDAWIAKQSERRVEIHAHLLLPDGRVAVAAIGQFHKLSEQKRQALLAMLPASERPEQNRLMQQVLNSAQPSKRPPHAD